jgi:hypothetical protein
MTDNQSKSASLIGKAAIVTGASREIGAAAITGEEAR